MTRRGRRLLALTAVLALGCARGRESFHFSGSITAPPPIQKLTERPNIVLYIIATNNGGVPIAVKEIVNPKLPVHYRMTHEDLVLPGPAWDGPLNVHVDVSTHGMLGTARMGDLRGTHRGAIRSGEHNVNIVIDKII